MVNRIIIKEPSGKLTMESVDPSVPLSTYLNRFPGSVAIDVDNFPVDLEYSTSWKLNPTPFQNVKLATTTVLPDSSSYSAGVITSTGDPGTLTIDSVVVSLGDRILVKNQTETAENGIYTVTDNGAGPGPNWELTRAADFVQVMTPIYASSEIHVDLGTTNADTSFVLLVQVNTIDTDPITFNYGTATSSVIIVDMDSAKEDHKEQLRRTRIPEFTRLDQLFIEASSRGRDTSAIETRQQYLRDITDDAAITAAANTTALKAVTIASWTEPVIGDVVVCDFKRTEVDAATYTMLSTDQHIGVIHTATAAVTLTLPEISSAGMKKYYIKDEGGNATTNVVTLDVSGSDVLDGSNSSVIINSDYGSVTVYNNGSTGWFTI